MIKIGDCPKCGRKNYRITAGVCHNCYRKHIWKRKLKVCKRCGREKPIHAKGYCVGCYNFVFHLDYNKAWNYKKDHNIDIELYKKITKSCVICGFNSTVDLHHLDGNKKNNSESNLIGLCPNHHKMLHDFKYRAEMLGILKEKGFAIQDDPKLEFKKD
jgi:ribosomal protein L37E